MLSYSIEHTGLIKDTDSGIYKDSDYINTNYHNRSGVVFVDTLCPCRSGKAIKYSFYWDDTSDKGYQAEQDYRELIHEDIINRYANKFRFCDDCENTILDKIKKEYA